MVNAEEKSGNELVIAGNGAIDDVVSWLLSYHPQPVTRTVCNRMRYFALLAHEVVNEIQTAVSNGSPDAIDFSHARFFSKVDEILGANAGRNLRCVESPA